MDNHHNALYCPYCTEKRNARIAELEEALHKIINDRDRERGLRLKLEEELSSPGWPHEYHDGFHRNNCRACDLLKKIKHGREQAGKD
jgi:hypothetical protein